MELPWRPEAAPPHTSAIVPRKWQFDYFGQTLITLIQKKSILFQFLTYTTTPLFVNTTSILLDHYPTVYFFYFLALHVFASYFDTIGNILKNYHLLMTRFDITLFVEEDLSAFSCHF